MRDYAAHFEAWQVVDRRLKAAERRLFSRVVRLRGDGASLTKVKMDGLSPVLRTPLSETARADGVQRRAPALLVAEALDVIEDIQVKLGGNDLTVWGEKHVDKEAGRARYGVVQCAYGRFRRDVTLPLPVEPTRPTTARGVP